MKSLKNFLRQPPILKPKAAQLTLSILPQPPTENRFPPNLARENISQSQPPKGKKLPMRESIDYDKLTANEQAKWDAGMYGSLHLKNANGHHYYVVRWFDPLTKTLRSNSLGKDETEAKARWRKMVLG
jgi:hypothetical protein